MPIQNKTMLITYSDSLGNNLKDLYENLEKHFGDAVGGVHLLPFFPSTGDRGFAPVDYDQVDPAFGDWEDVKRLGDKYYLMFDFMINHISRQSKYYKDYQEKHDQSAYKDLFLNWDKFWPENRPTQADVDLIYKRKDRAPKQEITFADGTTEHLWNTFGEEQIDLDVTKEVTMDFIRKTIEHLASNGCDLIRLDAFAYAVKKLDTNDFFVEPDIWDLLDKVRDMAAAYGAAVETDWYEGPPATCNDGFWASYAAEKAKERGLNVVPAPKSLGGEDFAFYQEKVPGMFVLVGTGLSAAIHNPTFRVDPHALAPTACYLAELVRGALGKVKER